MASTTISSVIKDSSESSIKFDLSGLIYDDEYETIQASTLTITTVDDEKVHIKAWFICGMTMPFNDKGLFTAETIEITSSSDDSDAKFKAEFAKKMSPYISSGSSDSDEIVDSILEKYYALLHSL